MRIETLKDLDALLKLCRKQGVSSISVDNITLQLGDMPEANSRTKSDAAKSVDTPDVLSDEEILMWSAANG